MTVDEIRGLEEAALAHWFEISANDMGSLIAEIEQRQPSNSDNPIDRMGVDSGLILKVFACRAINGRTKLFVARAIQHLCCARPWLKLPLAQFELF